MPEKKGTSLNKAMATLLEQSTGLTEVTAKRRDLGKFCGSWSESQADQFEQSIASFEAIDEQLWA